MQKLTRHDLWSLEEYATNRDSFRKRVINHKRRRRLQLSQHASLHFEDRFTMQYQIQEMLRTERIFESELIQEEIDTYNPLIPDGNNWKATLLFEYEDPVRRAAALQRMGGIEHQVFVKIGDSDPNFAIANEDLERTSDTKTAAVHFLRFQLDQESIHEIASGAVIQIGIDYKTLSCCVDVDETLRRELLRDLDLTA